MRHLVRILVVVATATVLPCTSASATFPGENGRIAWVNDVSGNREINSIEPNGAGRVNLTNNPATDEDPAWSPDGTRITFASNRSGRHEVYVMNADGSGLQQLTSSPPGNDSREPAWSPDGNQIVYTRILEHDLFESFCTSQLRIMADDGTQDAELALPGVRPCRRDPEWSPDGRYIAFLAQGGLRYVRPDGSGFVAAPSSIQPHWSPGTVWITRDAAPDDSRAYGPGSMGWKEQVWSPDGARIVRRCTTCSPQPPAGGFLVITDDAGGGATLLTTDDEGSHTDPDWQPLPPAPTYPGYARPQGATPLRVSLVPAFTECTAPDREHGPPLAFPSCTPAQASDYLTVGTGDVNGFFAGFVGSLRLSVLVGDPAEAGDQADVRLDFSMTDVRCRVQLSTCEAGATSDYTGEVEVVSRWRITDRFNSGLGTHPATVEIPSFVAAARYTAPCAATPDSPIGGRCQLNTSLDALLPGQVREGTRGIWALDQVQVFDGGADGSAASDDYGLFAVQGIFVP